MPPTSFLPKTFAAAKILRPAATSVRRAPGKSLWLPARLLAHSSRCAHKKLARCPNTNSTLCPSGTRRRFQRTRPAPHAAHGRCPPSRHRKGTRRTPRHMPGATSSRAAIAKGKSSRNSTASTPSPRRDRFGTSRPCGRRSQLALRSRRVTTESAAPTKEGFVAVRLAQDSHERYPAKLRSAESAQRAQRN